VLHAATKAEIEAAFAGFAQLRAGVLVIGADTFFNAKSRLLAELSLRDGTRNLRVQRVRQAGGMMSYGGSIRESYRWAGI